MYFDLGHIDHTPKPHPQSPTHQLPASFFAAFVQMNGPSVSSSSKPLSSVAAGPGELFSVTELPARFRFKSLSEQEIDNINHGGSEIVFA